MSGRIQHKEFEKMQFNLRSRRFTIGINRK